jgi:hypothetical protein
LPQRSSASAGFNLSCFPSAPIAFTLRRMSQRDLVDEIAGLAEVARKRGNRAPKRSRSMTVSAKGVASLPMAMTEISFATTSNGIATIF